MFEYAQQIGGTLIIAKNKVKYQALGFCIISLFTVILSFVLAKLFGAIGICISICLAGIANVILQNWIFSSKLNLDMTSFYQVCLRPLIIPMIITCGLGLFIMNQFETTWIKIIIVGAIISAIYLSLLFLLAVNSDERRYIFQFLKRHE